jgi:uroporphyrinogen decarboxylase
MGNLSPLKIGVRGTPEEVKTATLDLLQRAGRGGVILSLGGGVSPGMPRANIRAMMNAVTEFNSP